MGAVREHLKGKYGILPGTTSDGFNAAEYFRKLGLDPSNVSHQPIIDRLLVSVDLDAAMAVLRRWIVVQRIPFDRVGDPLFR